MTNLLQKYLKNSNFISESKEFSDYFISHQDYPSLYAITDTFDVLGIENVAAKVPNEQFDELPDHFLSFVVNTSNQEELVVITKKSETVTIEFEKQKKIVPTHEFLNLWNNIVVAIEAKDIQESKKIVAKNNTILYLLPIILISGIVFYYNEISILNVSFYILNLLGFLFSVFILQEKYGTETEMISKLCNFSESTSCDSVITSSNGKINSWLQVSDLPILFFSINLISLLFNFQTKGIMGAVSFLSIPLLLYFVWIQKMKIKKWCVLCLIISLVIFFQGIIWLSYMNYEAINLYDFSFYLISAVLCITLWLFINPILNTNKKLQEENLGFKKFKRNYSIFQTLEKPIVNEMEFKNLKGISIGNNEAPIKLSLFVSPSCGHCHNFYRKALELTQKFNTKIQLKILFNVNADNQDNPYISIVKTVLEINRNNPEKAVEAMSDWHLKRLSLENWTAKWQQPSISQEVEDYINAQYIWCQENGLNYTPVTIVNTKISPQEYDLEELKYFLSDIIENDSL